MDNDKKFDESADNADKQAAAANAPMGKTGESAPASGVAATDGEAAANIEQGENSDESAAGDDALTKARAEVRRLEEENRDLLYQVSELDNAKKRAEKQSRDAQNFILQTFSAAICEVRDCLELALDNVDDKSREGVELTLRKLTTAMEVHGITPIAPDIGAPFDPALHQSIGAQENGELDIDTVATVVVKGYTLNGRVIRPASVMVAGKKES